MPEVVTESRVSNGQIAKKFLRMEEEARFSPVANVHSFGFLKKMNSACSKENLMTTRTMRLPNRVHRFLVREFWREEFIRFGCFVPNLVVVIFSLSD